MTKSEPCSTLVENDESMNNQNEGKQSGRKPYQRPTLTKIGIEQLLQAADEKVTRDDLLSRLGLNGLQQA